MGENIVEVNIEFLNGLNTIEIRPSVWNWNTKAFDSTDQRQLALKFDKIQIGGLNIDYIANFKQSFFSDETPLFGDIEAQTILIGTSYSEENNINDLKFASFIRAFSGVDVLNFSRGAGGISSALRDFMESNQFTDGQKHTVLWEFPLTDTIYAGNQLDQIISGLKFKECPIKKVIRSESKTNSPILIDNSTVVQVVFENQSVTTASLTGDGFNLSLSNNPTQGSKSIYYFSTKKLSHSSFQVKSDIESKIYVNYCTT